MNHDVTPILDCYQSCLSTIKQCLEIGGEHASKEHINLLIDCSKICQMATDFTIRESENRSEVLKLCAEICRACADQCEAMSQDNEHMKACAEMCRSCAKTCDEISS